MEHSDEALIQQYQEGNQAALVSLTSRYFDAIYRYSYRLARDPAATEDIVQDTFIKVWKSIAGFNKGMSVKPWIYRIAHNTVIDEGEDFKESIPDESVGVLEQAVAREEKELLTQKIEALPLQYKQVVLLRVEELLTFEEISLSLNKPLNTVKSLYRRALLLLQK